jgi:hypothetical protein
MRHFFARVFMPPLGMKASNIFGHGLAVQFVIDHKEQIFNGLRRLIDELDSGGFAKGHGKIAIHGATEWPFWSTSFPKCNIERQGYKMAACRVTNPEKVPQGRPDAGSGVIIPVHFKDQFAQVHFVVTTGGHPDMLYTSGACCIHQYGGFSGFNDPEITVSPGCIIAGRPF